MSRFDNINMAALARREPPHYTYKRKVYIGKTKSPNSGIVGQMMYYCKYILIYVSFDYMGLLGEAKNYKVRGGK